MWFIENLQYVLKTLFCKKFLLFNISAISTQTAIFDWINCCIVFKSQVIRKKWKSCIGTCGMCFKRKHSKNYTQPAFKIFIKFLELSVEKLMDLSITSKWIFLVWTVKKVEDKLSEFCLKILKFFFHKKLDRKMVTDLNKLKLIYSLIYPGICTYSSIVKIFLE